MKRFFVGVFLVLVTTLALLCVDIKPWLSFVLVVVGVLVLCWAVYCWCKENVAHWDEDDETLLETEGEEKDDSYPIGIRTNQLCMNLLQKMNIRIKACPYDWECYDFQFLGEDMCLKVPSEDGVCLKVSTEDRYFTLYDREWKKYPDLEKGIYEEEKRVLEAVNRVNRKGLGVTLYTRVSSGDIYISSATRNLLVPEIPNIEDYFSDIFRRLFKVHEIFEETLSEILKEEIDDQDEEKENLLGEIEWMKDKQEEKMSDMDWSEEEKKRMEAEMEWREEEMKRW